MHRFVVSAPDAATAAVAEQVIQEHLGELIEQQIEPEIAAVADAANLPPGFKEHIAYQITGHLQFRVGNTWKKETEDGTLPLGLWFEEGTDGHEVAARRFKKMRWVNLPTSFKPHPPNEGKVSYSKRHWIRGIPRTQATSRGLREASHRFVEAAARLVEREIHARSGRR